MAGSPSNQPFPPITREPFPTITREEIGNKLRSEYDNVEATKSIDCFYIQAHYFFRDWIDAAGQRDIEQKIGEVIETFLQDRMKKIESEKWSRVTDWWPLYYFMVSESRSSDPQPQETDNRKQEKILNDEVRKELKKKLKEANPNFSAIPIIITRAAKYTPTD